MKWFTSKKQALLISLMMVVGIGGLGWWLFGSRGEQVGELVEDQGRDHVTDTRGFAYNSTPPTSGPHYTQWTKRGVYDEPIEDGYLIHSLEHGYVIISYRCNGRCEELKGQLKAFYDKNKSRRVIIVPRADLKTPIALTAWNRLLALQQWDETMAQKFVKAWENKGPERTME